MRRIRIRVAYDGTCYCGWQIQKNGKSIEEALNKAISCLTKEEIHVIGASRTDSGVHALGNIAVFDTGMKMKPDKFSFAINQYLPDDIRVVKSEEVDINWHPRKQNCIKTYRYRIYNNNLPNPLERLYSDFCYYELSIEKMREGAAYLIGEHDFTSFCTPRTQTDNMVRTIYDIVLTKEDRMITITFRGDGFLYNMIRIISGTLERVGTGMYAPEMVRDMLRARDRMKAGPKAVAAGLTLMNIDYNVNSELIYDTVNEDWSYILDLSGTGKNNTAELLIRKCRDEDYTGLVMRLLHKAWRNGALRVMVKDEDRPERLAPGMNFGFYSIGEMTVNDGFYMVDCEQVNNMSNQPKKVLKDRK